MNKKYWLRTGIIFVLLYVILVIITMPKDLAINMDEFIFGLGMLQYPVTVIEELLGDTFYNTIPALICGGLVTWFILGALVGLVYGKVKNLVGAAMR